MQCRLLRGLAGALLTLLCLGLLSLRYHVSRSPKSVQETPRLSPPRSPPPPELQLQDVYIAVKTTRAFHRSRLDLLLDTWVSRTREQLLVWGKFWFYWRKLLSLASPQTFLFMALSLCVPGSVASRGLRPFLSSLDHHGGALAPDEETEAQGGEVLACVSP